MSNLSKAEAQLRADHIRIFREELARLESSGIVELSATQRQAIDQHHEALLASYAQLFDIDRDRQAKQLSLGMRVASGRWRWQPVCSSCSTSIGGCFRPRSR
jgi:hypothetical protein